MSLKPVIDVVFDKTTKTITVTDVTGFYNASTNPQGWGTPNTQRTDITDAYVLIHKNQELIKKYGVADQVVAATDPEFSFTNIDLVLNDDAVYKIFYSLNNHYMSFGKLVFNYTIIEKKISEFWARLACIYDLREKQILEKECKWLEANLQGLKALEERGKESDFINLYSFIETRISVNEYLLL